MDIQYTEFGVGIQYVSKNNVLKDKIQTGFLGKHPDAPSNMELSLNDIAELKNQFILYV